MENQNDAYQTQYYKTLLMFSIQFFFFKVKKKWLLLLLFSYIILLNIYYLIFLQLKFYLKKYFNFKFKKK
jgi:hypothetical protein